MGQPKALLEWQGRTFVSRLVQAGAEAGLDEIVVVTGIHDSMVRAEVNRIPTALPVRVVFNANHVRGQLSSLLAGLDGLAEPADAVLMMLVDHPFVQVETLRHIIQTYVETRAPVVVPTFDARRGHPVLFSGEALAALRTTPLEEGARAVVSAFAGLRVEVPVPDPGVRIDLDTPEDLARARRLLGSGDPVEPS